MASRRGSSCCALCEGSNLPSCCAACVNARLMEYHAKLRMMRRLRESLHARIAARLEAKSKADEQRTWIVSKTQDIKELRDRLSELKRQTAIEKTKVEQSSSDHKAQTASLNLAFVTLKKRRPDAVTMHTNAMKVAQMNPMTTNSERLKMQSKSIKQPCRLFPMRRVGLHRLHSRRSSSSPPSIVWSPATSFRTLPATAQSLSSCQIPCRHRRGPPPTASRRLRRLNSCI